jgi:hypothetical protein
MKSFKSINSCFIIICSIMFGFAFSGCSDLPVGNNFLSSPPTLDYTQDSVFKSEQDAKRLLINIYATLPWPLSLYYVPYQVSQKRAVGPHWNGEMTPLTDLAWDQQQYQVGPIYSGNFNSATSGVSSAYQFGSNNLAWKAFYEGWELINNIDKVPGMSKDEKERWKAEVKTIMALQYIIMFRDIGGIVWVNHAYAGNDTIPEHPRLTAIASVDSIANLLDEAIPHLPSTVPKSELGRMTKVAAAALKTRLLLFAASPLMNSSKPYMEGEAAAKNLVWMGGYKPNLWERAAKAAKETIKLINKSGYYHMVEPDKRDSAGYRKAYRRAYFDRGSPEILLSLRLNYKPQRNLMASFTAFRTWSTMDMPTQNYVEMFPDKNGIPIKKSSLYDPTHPYRNRDPRFYETITSNISMWGSRHVQLWKGGEDATRGPAIGGYLPRKYVFNVTKSVDSPMQFAYIRIPEIYLSYAEALDQINNGPTPEAYHYVNLVRHRVGLVDLQKIMKNPSSKKEFRKKIIKERALELGLENVRWYDLVRWKMKDVFTEQLYAMRICKKGASPKGACPDEGVGYHESNTYIYAKYKALDRYWKDHFSPKWYLWPMPRSEVQKGYGLVQNPGW